LEALLLGSCYLGDQMLPNNHIKFAPSGLGPRLRSAAYANRYAPKAILLPKS